MASTSISITASASVAVAPAAAATAAVASPRPRPPLPIQPSPPPPPAAAAAPQDTISLYPLAAAARRTALGSSPLASASTPDLPTLASVALSQPGAPGSVPGPPPGMVVVTSIQHQPSATGIGPLGRHVPAAKRLSSTSSSSELSQRSRATSGTSGRTRVGSNPLAVRPISASTSTLVSSSTSSRPSSVASNSSQSSTERSSGTTHALLSPTLLSPALASTLAAGRSAAQGPLSHKRMATGNGSAAGAITGRRISLPNVPSMVNRVSMVSVASFESLPEDEALGIQSPHSPTLSDSSSSAATFSPRSDLRRFPALPPSPRLRSSLGVTTDSPPTSPDLPRAAPLQPTRLSRPKSSLKRSSTEPYGMGKEFETLMNKRRFVAMELLDTERAYMQSLKLLDENFLKPMQRASIGQPPLTRTTAPCPQLSKKVIAEIFSNFTNIITLNKELLSQLEKRLGPPPAPESLVPSAATTAEPTSIPARPVSVASADSAGSGGSELIMASSLSSSIAAANSSTSLYGASGAASIQGNRSTSSLVSSGSNSILTGPAAPAPTMTGWNPREDLLGDILVPMAPFLSMYKLFAQNFSNSLARIEAERKRDDAFARFVRAAERAAWTSSGPGQAGFGLGFEAHLLTIVQRITRYKMLVGDLVKFTPEGHPDRAELVKAFNLVSQIAHDCDDNIRTHEMVLLMLNIQRSLTGLTEPLVVPGRSLLKRGALLKSCRKNIQPREFFLFSDCIVYASPTSGGMESSASAAWQAMVGGGASTLSFSVWGGGVGSVAEAWVSGSPSLSGALNKRGSSNAATSTPPSSGFGARVRTNSASAAEEEAGTTAAAGSGSASGSSSGSGSGSSSKAIVAPVSLQAQSLHFRAKIALQDCTVVSVELAHHLAAGFSSSSAAFPSSSASSTGTEGLRHSFELRTPEKSFALYAESRESKEDWMTRIREAKEAHMIARRTLKAEEDSIEAKRERRRSLYKDQKAAAAAVAGGHGFMGANGGGGAAALSSSAPHSGGAAGRISALRSSIPFSSSSNSIATVREGEPFPSSESGEGSPLVCAGGNGGGSAALEGRLSPRNTILSMSPSANGLQVVRERQRLNSLQSLTAALPTPSLGALLSPTMGGAGGAAPPKPLKVVEDYNAPVWVPDSHADKCAVCSDGFGLWRRKHHCRLCGQVVCWNCSQRSFLIPAYQEGAEDQQARACDRCFESMFPPSEDEASPSPSPPDMTMPLPPTASSSSSSPALSSHPSGLGVRKAQDGGGDRDEVDDEQVEEEEDEEEDEDLLPIEDEADQTARARPMPMPMALNSTPTSRPSGTGASTGRPISVRVDSDASPASPATPADGPSGPPPLLLLPSTRKGLNLVDTGAGAGSANGANSTSNIGGLLPTTMMTAMMGSAASPRLFDPAAAGALLGKTQPITAATSGAGTFRLVTPRMTTPEWEAPPALVLREDEREREAADNSSKALLMGGEREREMADTSVAGNTTAAASRSVSLDENSDYFTGAGAAAAAAAAAASVMSPRRRKKVFSAAARLSSFYGQAIAASGAGGASSLARGGAASVAEEHRPSTAAPATATATAAASAAK